MHMRKKTLCAVVPLLFTLACGGEGGGSSLTGPSNQTPNVAGTYSGTTSIAFPELGQNVSCTTTTSVTQTGSTVTIAPLQLRGGNCGVLSIPIGDASITASGSLGQETGTFSEPSCGGSYNYSFSGGFFGRSLQLSFVATSRTCYNMNMTVNLTR